MTIPEIKIPVEIPPVITDAVPHMLHPILVHFVIVLPIIVVILELVNMIMKRKSLTVSIYLLFILGIIVFAGAYLSGITDGSEAGPLLGAAGQDELKDHKHLGTLLLYLTLVPIVFKIFSVIVKKVWAKILYIILLIAFAALTVYQAKAGGELVYKHGANVQAVQVAEDKIEKLEDEINELKSSHTDKAVTAVQNAVEKEVHEKVVVDLSDAAVTDEEVGPEEPVEENEVSASVVEVVEPAAQEIESQTAIAEEVVTQEHKAPVAELVETGHEVVAEGHEEANEAETAEHEATQGEDESPADENK